MRHAERRIARCSDRMCGATDCARCFPGGGSSEPASSDSALAQELPKCSACAGHGYANGKPAWHPVWTFRGGPDSGTGRNVSGDCPACAGTGIEVVAVCPRDDDFEFECESSLEDRSVYAARLDPGRDGAELYQFCDACLDHAEAIWTGDTPRCVRLDILLGA